MNSREYAFLLLSSKLGNPERKPLTTAQLRLLAQRMMQFPDSDKDSELTMQHLASIGLDAALSERILTLLEDELSLNAYLANAKKQFCFPLTRSNPDYPLILRKRLGLDSPGCLWLKGDPSLLGFPAVSLVGSRDLYAANRTFAKTVGVQAASQGYVLVSGNARGADQTAQNACLASGGYVISVVADDLRDHPLRDHVLYISEEGFDESFSPQRALSRNRIIHCLGEITFSAQARMETGGTWDGCVRNLRNQWSPLFCFGDGSEACMELNRMGAELISASDLSDFKSLKSSQLNLF